VVVPVCYWEADACCYAVWVAVKVRWYLPNPAFWLHRGAVASSNVHDLWPFPLSSHAAYIASLVFTLYAALMMHSYIFSLVSCLAQVRG
jgi:hypothetical protein